MKAMRSLTLTAMLALAALVNGCVVHEHRHDYIAVEPGHVHSPTCGHYYQRGHWYYVPNHVHGRGCGHVLRSGIWVTIR